MLNTLAAGSALPGHDLVLKTAYMVIPLRIIDPKSGNWNGSRYNLEKMTDNLVFLRLVTGTRAGSRMCLPRMPCGPGDSNIPIEGFLRTQFPIRVCFGITVNKVQGQSFSSSLVQCFSHEHLYVALSRTTPPSKLIITNVIWSRRDQKRRLL